MGAWGTALYSCDIAEDVRDACKDIFAFYDIKQGNDLIFSHFKYITEQSYIDNEYASFWYALSDWQWKHGMLTDSVKNKALDLLNNYAGLEDWINNGNMEDVKKRKKVLTKLKEQLLSSQPQYKKIKASVIHAKHKPGDIIIFKAPFCTSFDSDFWKIESLRLPIFFESNIFLNSKHENIDGYNAQGKYMSLLCIGSVKERHSQYIENVFDERSLYVWYDFLSFTKPTHDTIKKCGFLPFILWELKDFNRKTTKSANWGYTFTLACENFRISNEISEVFKEQDLSEVDRFNQLFSKKHYSSNYLGGYSLLSMFNTVFGEKNRAELLGEQIDNLLNTKLINPALSTPSRIDYNLRMFIKAYPRN